MVLFSLGGILDSVTDRTHQLREALTVSMVTTMATKTTSLTGETENLESLILKVDTSTKWLTCNSTSKLWVYQSSLQVYGGFFEGNGLPVTEWLITHQ